MSRGDAQPGSTRRDAQRERFRKNFNDCLHDRGLTHAQIARQLNVVVGTVHNWAQGQALPNLETAVRLAGVLNVAPLRVLDWAGWLPGIADLTLYIEQLEGHLAASEAARLEVPVGGVRGVGHLAHALAANGRYSFRIVPWLRGRDRYRRHYADWTVIDGGCGELTRDTVQAETQRAFVHTSSFWNRQEDWDHCLDPPRRDLVICTPRFVDLRRGSGLPAEGAPRAIAVLGQHWCGHAEVARFLAEALDYDFASAGSVAASLYGSLPHEFGGVRRERAWIRDRQEVARTYTLDAELGRPRAWSANIWEDLDSLLIALSQPRLPFVVYLRPVDDAIEFAAAMRVHCGHTDLAAARDEAARLRETRRKVEATLREVDPARYLIQDVDCPPDLGTWVGNRPPYGADEWFDTYARTATTVLRRIVDPAVDLTAPLKAAGL